MASNGNLSFSNKRPNTPYVAVESFSPSKRARRDSSPEFSLEECVNEKLQNLKNEIESKFADRFDKLETVVKVIRDVLELHMNQNNHTERLLQSSLSPQESPAINENNYHQPTWIVPEAVCINIFQKANKQIVQFINEYLLLLCDYYELFLQQIPPPKWQELGAVLHHFWKKFPENFDLAKEIRKERLSERFLIKEKIKKQLQKCDGVIIARNGEMFGCRWSRSGEKFVPLVGEYISVPHSNWACPKEIMKDPYFLAVSKNEKKLYQIKIETGEAHFLASFWHD